MSRRAFFLIHSWLGLITGIAMLAVAWSGAIVVFNDEIEWLVNARVRADPARGTRPIDEVLAAVQAAHPGLRLALHPQISPRWAHIAYVYEGRTQRFLQIDPASAAIVTDTSMEGYTFNVAYFLRQLHVRLLMGYWGRVFVGVLGVTLVLSVATSLVIYRQWLLSLLRIRRSEGRRIFHMDLHKAIGAWSLVFNLIFGVTGGVLGLENLYYRIWPRAAEVTPAVSTEVEPLAAGLTAGGIVKALADRDPAFRVTSIEVTPGKPVVIRGNHPGALIATGASSYTVDAPSGAVLAATDARRAAWGEYLYNVLDPLHFGYFGSQWGVAVGYAVKVLWCVTGLAPGALAVTGGTMWIIRRRRRTGAKPG